MGKSYDPLLFVFTFFSFVLVCVFVLLEHFEYKGGVNRFTDPKVEQVVSMMGILDRFSRGVRNWYPSWLSKLELLRGATPLFGS